MEDPATWGPLEKAIADAWRQAEEGRAKGKIGLSTVRQIADKLRERGLVKDAITRAMVEDHEDEMGG